jgi:sulfoxide reductase heme-binding subunit YedZ
MILRFLSSRWTKLLVFSLSSAPLLVLGWRALHENLGANPVEFITRSTGDWTMRFLLLTLAISPLRKIAGLAALIRFRRMLGLFSFFYGSLHLVTYVWFDKFFDPGDILKDIATRRFITIGLFGLLAMLPLAVTSTAGWIRQLGGRRWQLLHRLVYVCAVAGVVHYCWLVKSDFRLPLLYAVITGLLLLYRLAAWTNRLVTSRLMAGVGGSTGRVQPRRPEQSGPVAKLSGGVASGRSLVQ